jgi:3-oxoacyl-[acyl-carrier-protein] synthase-1
MPRSIYIQDFSIVCPLGDDQSQVRTNLLSKRPPSISGRYQLNDGRSVPAGTICLPKKPETASPSTRCNRIAELCIEQLLSTITNIREVTHPGKIGVVIGTCTSGVQEGTEALRARLGEGVWPASFSFNEQELGDTASYVAKRIGAEGPVYGISTACTSGAKALVSGARLIQAGLCDTVVAGGIDSLGELTIHGFSALESLSADVCNPFSTNRCGINLGEGGALFVLSTACSGTRIAGWGESADAYHISAPDPEGRGAQAAMERALARATLKASDIGYLNLHGTATKLNDAMEAIAVSRVLGSDAPCSSTKPMTGHLLGAAGACEAALSIMALHANRLPLHLWDGERDRALPKISLVEDSDATLDSRRVMSTSYAFGGNNIALILERE